MRQTKLHEINHEDVSLPEEIQGANVRLYEEDSRIQDQCPDMETIAGIADRTLLRRWHLLKWFRAARHIRGCEHCNELVESVRPEVISNPWWIRLLSPFTSPVFSRTVAEDRFSMQPGQTAYATSGRETGSLLKSRTWSMPHQLLRAGALLSTLLVAMVCWQIGRTMGLGIGFQAGLAKGRAESIVFGPDKGAGSSPFPPLSPEGKVWNEIPPATNRRNIERAIWTLTRYTKHPKGPTPATDPLRYAELLYYKMELRKLSADRKEQEKLDQEIADLNKQMAPDRGRLKSWMKALQGGSTDEKQAQ